MWGHLREGRGVVRGALILGPGDAGRQDGGRLPREVACSEQRTQRMTCPGLRSGFCSSGDTKVSVGLRRRTCLFQTPEKK